jgi:hypothetical protein
MAAGVRAFHHRSAHTSPEAAMHLSPHSAPSRRPTTRAVHLATRPRANPPLDDAALRRSLAALERVVGH